MSRPQAELESEVACPCVGLETADPRLETTGSWPPRVLPAPAEVVTPRQVVRRCHGLRLGDVGYLVIGGWAERRVSAVQAGGR